MVDAFPLSPFPHFPSPSRYPMKGGTHSVQVKQRVFVMVLVPEFQQVFFMTYTVHLLNHKLGSKSQILVWLGTKASNLYLPQYLEERLPAGQLPEVTAPGLGGCLGGGVCLLQKAWSWLLRDHLSLLPLQVHCIHSQTKGHKENMDFLVRKRRNWTL